MIWVSTLLGHAKLEVKIISEFFHLQSTLDSEFFRGDVWGRTFFGHAKFEVKNFSEIFQLQSTMYLNCPGEGDLGINSFWLC